jgi:hypothetical protein
LWLGQFIDKHILYNFFQLAFLFVFFEESVIGDFLFPSVFFSEVSMASFSSKGVSLETENPGIRVRYQ